MKSITDATWKDAAVIEARSLVASLEDLAGRAIANPQAMLAAPFKQIDLERLVRRAVRVAEAIDKIEEKPARRRPHTRGDVSHRAARARS